MNEQVSVIIPIVRPEKAARAIEAVELHCPGVEIIAEEDTGRIGCPKMVKKLVEKTTRPIVMFLGDDTIIKAGALQNAMREMEELPDGWGVVGLCTHPGTQYNAHCHWLAHKNMLPLLGGEFFSTAYEHCYCDDELEDIAKEHERWAWAKDAQVYHDHPVNGGEPDEFYTVAYNDGAWQRDRATYHRRKRMRKGGLLAIGFPLVNDQVHVNFFTSFSMMRKPDQYQILIPQSPHGPWGCNLAQARDSIVSQALLNGASHLMMCDTDQVYPPDTLAKLASHDVDVCGVLVHRRWPPFDPIFMRGSLKTGYEHVGPEDMYSGKLIEIDATGTGCLLINMAIFDEMCGPWFMFDTIRGEGVGEDFYFCNKIREAGFRIFVDTGVEVGHLATIEINRTLHEICKTIPLKKGG